MSLKKCKILSPLILFVPGKESAHEFKQPWLNTTFARCFALRVISDKIQCAACKPPQEVLKGDIIHILI